MLAIFFVIHIFCCIDSFMMIWLKMSASRLMSAYIFNISSFEQALVLSNYDFKGDFLLLFKLILGTKVIGSDPPFGQIFKLYC